MGAGPHILLVEDDPDTRTAMTLVLEMNGYQVTSAANGQEALDRLRREPRPCLIFLDLMMPVLDGWEFCKQQRQDPRLAVIPVIVLSADRSVADTAASIGATDFLQKPIQLEELLASAQRHCAASPIARPSAD